jgi:hypothetical protein
MNGVWCSFKAVLLCTAMYKINNFKTQGKEAQTTWANIKVLFIQRMNDEKGQENCTFHFP